LLLEHVNIAGTVGVFSALNIHGPRATRPWRKPAVEPVAPPVAFYWQRADKLARTYFRIMTSGSRSRHPPR